MWDRNRYFGELGAGSTRSFLIRFDGKDEHCMYSKRHISHSSLRLFHKVSTERHGMMNDVKGRRLKRDYSC